MNAQQEIDRLLAASGAVLIRQNKHLVYRLPNGQNFVAAKTSSDPDRAAKNSLSDLRRALGAQRRSSTQEPTVMEQPQETDRRSEHTEPPTPSAGQAPQSPLRSRVESMIAREEAAQEALMAEAQQLERRVHMLKALLPFADDPATEVALKAIASPPPTPPARPAPPPPEPPEPPQQITDRVQVTRELVFAATQTFDGTFTVNDVMARMLNGAAIDGPERQRVRSSIAGAIMALYERGEVIREAEGIGKRQAIWKKVVPDPTGTGQVRASSGEKR